MDEEYKPLYLAYKDTGYLKEHSKSEAGLIFHSKAIRGVKVVACPFCGVSTSSGETITVDRETICLWCSSCNVVAFSPATTKLVTREVIAELYPRSSTLEVDDTVFHLAKIYKITRIINKELDAFKIKENMENNDIAAFYDQLIVFCNEHKIDTHKAEQEDVKEFLESNELAIKYKIKFGRYAGDDMSLKLNSYNLLDVKSYLRDTVFVEFKSYYYMEIICKEMPWF